MELEITSSIVIFSLLNNLLKVKNVDMKSANLVRADFMQAEIKNTRLEGANLKMAEGLTPEQLASAHTDEKTILPA